MVGKLISMDWELVRFVDSVSGFVDSVSGFVDSVSGFVD
jgi:hypothetical protein